MEPLLYVVMAVRTRPERRRGDWKRITPIIPNPVVLTCPECRSQGLTGQVRIGQRRSQCATCNRFNAAVLRHVGAALMEMYPADHARLRHRIELELYRNVIDDAVAAALAIQQ